MEWACRSGIESGALPQTGCEVNEKCRRSKNYQYSSLQEKNKLKPKNEIGHLQQRQAHSQ
jgi:hypothetical protein